MIIYKPVFLRIKALIKLDLCFALFGAVAILTMLIKKLVVAFITATLSTIVLVFLIATLFNFIIRIFFFKKIKSS